MSDGDAMLNSSICCAVLDEVNLSTAAARGKASVSEFEYTQ